MIKRAEAAEERKSATVKKGKRIDPRAVPRDQEHPDFVSDSTGQLELKNIDSDIGKCAETMLMTRVVIETEQEKLVSLGGTMIAEMKKAKISRFKHKGECFILQPAKKSEEKLTIKHAE